MNIEELKKEINGYIVNVECGLNAIKNTLHLIENLKCVCDKISHSYVMIFGFMSDSPEVTIFFKDNSFSEFLETMKKIKKTDKFRGMRITEYDVEEDNRIKVYLKNDSHACCFRFSIKGNPDEIIKKISGGKCKILDEVIPAKEESKIKKVVCNIREVE